MRNCNNFEPTTKCQYMHQAWISITPTSTSVAWWYILRYESSLYVRCVCNHFRCVVIVKDDIINKILGEYRKMCGIVLSFCVAFIVCTLIRPLFCWTMHLPHRFAETMNDRIENIFSAKLNKCESCVWRKRLHIMLFFVCLCQTYFIGYSILSPFAITYSFSHNHRYRCLKSRNVWMSSKNIFPEIEHLKNQ